MLHSASEAFPNTLLEAMACECVCVATDVGPVKELLEQEKIIERQNYQQCFYAVKNGLDLSGKKREQTGIKNREKVVASYSIQKIVCEYERIYFEVAKEMNVKRIG